jgi:hypothetical protein
VIFSGGRQLPRAPGLQRQGTFAAGAWHRWPTYDMAATHFVVVKCVDGIKQTTDGEPGTRQHTARARAWRSCLPTATRTSGADNKSITSRSDRDGCPTRELAGEPRPMVSGTTGQQRGRSVTRLCDLKRVRRHFARLPDAEGVTKAGTPSGITSGDSAALPSCGCQLARSCGARRPRPGIGSS